MTIVVIGDALLDRDVHGSVERISPDAPVPVLDREHEVLRPGGAGLAAALAARDGQEVRLVTALAADPAASALRAALERAGVEVIDLGLDGTTPEKVRFFAGEQQLLRVDHGERGAAVGAATTAARAALSWADAILVADYGRGVAAQEQVRETLAERCPLIPTVWDPHPRGPAPVAGVTVATPNEAELRLASRAGRDGPGASDLGGGPGTAALGGGPGASDLGGGPGTAALGGGPGAADLAAQAEALAERWAARAVCVTRGKRGAVLAVPGEAPLAIPAEEVRGGDPCGAGDRFSSRLAAALAGGAELAAAVTDAVAAASAFVGAGGARGVGDGEHAARRPTRDPFALAREMRAAGGTVVATGGCFDLLHAGHVSTLQAARALGDCLIVCLNSDGSVRRLKGPGRPVVAQQERATLLEALRCVDAVAIFDEDTPEAVLRELRPHVWAKGGDYGSTSLPEGETIRAGGGRVVVLPFVEGHSTTRLIAAAGAGG